MTVCSAIYGLVLIYETLLSEGRYVPGDLNREPNFKILGLKRFYVMNFWHLEFHQLAFFLGELIGNFLLLIPFPFMVYYFFKRKIPDFLMVVLIFCTTVTIETLQLFFKIGYFDIDDILLNFIGGIVGIIFFNFIYRKFLL